MEEMQVSLTPGERQRFKRHLLLPQVGEEGQIRLKNSRVLIAGAGGLGSPLALYLAAAGDHRPGGFRPGGCDQPAATDSVR